MSDPLADLKRRAYARPDDDGVAVAAQAELARLADEQRRLAAPDAPPTPPAHPPAVASVPRRAKLLLAAASLATALIASGIAFAPHPSLEIFAMPQSGVPEWPGAAAGDDDIRWLGSRGPWDVFGLITAGGNVCVTAFTAGASGGGSCTSLTAFKRNGLALETSSGAANYLTVTWGPLGGAQLDDARR